MTDGIHNSHTEIFVNVENRTLINTSNLHLSKEIFTVSVQENLESNKSTLLSLWPSDAEFGESFVFEILNPHPAFKMDQRIGILRLNPIVTLDRELTPKLYLDVLCRPISSNITAITSRIQIEVEDVNDCIPIFQQSFYSATVSEEAIPGSRLLSIKALDADLGMNGVVRYSLENAPNFLEINKYDGRINIVNFPDSLKNGENFNFYVLATDRGELKKLFKLKFFRYSCFEF